MQRYHQGNGDKEIERPSETQPLLLSSSRAASLQACCHQQHQLLCMRSKSAFLVVLWNFLVGAVYGPKVVTTVLIFLKYEGLKGLPYFLEITLASYASLALLMLFYPLSTFIADVYVGRFKTLLTSLWLIWIVSLVTSVGAITYFMAISQKDQGLFEAVKIPFIVLGSIFGLMMAVGLAGFKANVVQFGTDQLLEAPGEELSFFVHWYVWTEYVGNGLAEVVFTFYSCSLDVVIDVIAFLPLIITLGLMCVLCYSCSAYSWFTTSTLPENHNPYKMVLQVLNFARRHKYPIQSSSMTYYDGKPFKRLDLGKQKYGGPYTTEQVEDVKTLLRVLGVLLTACSVFVIEIPAAYSIPLLANHIRPNFTSHCSANSILLEPGTLSTVVIIVVLPIYIRLIHPYFRRHMPGILKRLGMGITIFWLSVLCNFMIDTIGHGMHHNVSCMFLIDFSSYSNLPPNSSNVTVHNQTTLEIDTTFLLIPNVLTGIAYAIMTVAMLEFICAQSPHSMKGLLMGLFFAFRGMFELVGAGVTVPFSFGPWSDSYPIFPSCGFYYYLLNMVLGFVGLVSYIVTARRYRYRQREELSNDRISVEEYFTHQEEMRESSS